MIYEVKAYAKVNLHLEVPEKRDDGYHNIFSLNCSVNLFDLLKLNVININDDSYGKVIINIIPSGGKYEEIIRTTLVRDNLITKAIEIYFKRIGKSGEVSISVEKNIPAGAGLGGGSSDAATTLRLLNDVLKCIDNDELIKLGVDIGADVTYCIIGGYAICQGVGDLVEKIDGELNYWILIAISDIHINTGWAYNSLQRGSLGFVASNGLGRRGELFRKGLKDANISIFKDILKNDFEDPVFREYPELKDIKEKIASMGADYATMTGSGSTLIGLFSDFEKASLAAKSLENSVKDVYITKFI